MRGIASNIILILDRTRGHPNIYTKKRVKHPSGFF